jgi:hypothetical protein
MSPLFQPFQTGVLVLVVADEREGAADSVGGDELLEQGSGELNVLAGGAFGDDVAGGSAIVVQILVGGEAKVKLVSFHGIIRRQQNRNYGRKQGMTAGRLGDKMRNRFAISKPLEPQSLLFPNL